MEGLHDGRTVGYVPPVEGDSAQNAAEVCDGAWSGAGQDGLHFVALRPLPVLADLMAEHLDGVPAEEALAGFDGEVGIGQSLEHLSHVFQVQVEVAAAKDEAIIDIHRAEVPRDA